VCSISERNIRKKIYKKSTHTVHMLEENTELEEQKDSNRNDIEVDGQNQVVTDRVTSLIQTTDVQLL